MTMDKSFVLAIHSVLYASPKTAQEIVHQFDSLESFIDHSHVYFSEKGLKSESITAIQTKLKKWDYKKEQEKLDKDTIQTLFFWEDNYPSQLLEIYDYPLVLYAKGNISFLKEPILSVVGSRQLSEYGERTTETILKPLLNKLVITSGLALGIDTCAHKVALNNGYPTIAVLGTSVNQCYPKQNIDVYDRIIEKGLIISEFPPGSSSHKFHFPQRNRIISGLSLGVLIVEAHEKSGSLITARLGMEQNRDVFAVPGSIYSAPSKGTNQLIQQGAKCVTCAQDILQDLAPFLETTLLPSHSFSDSNKSEKTKADATTFISLNKDEEKMRQLLSEKPYSIDELIIETKLPISTILQSISFLEMKKIIVKGKGDLYTVKS